MASLTTFTSGTKAKSSEVNANFQVVKTTHNYNGLAFGGDGSDGALNVTSGTTTLTRSKVFNYSSINISAGAILTVNTTYNTESLMILCSGNCVIDGTINLVGLGGNGGAVGTNPTSGEDVGYYVRGGGGVNGGGQYYGNGGGSAVASGGNGSIGSNPGRPYFTQLSTGEGSGIACTGTGAGGGRLGAAPGKGGCGLYLEIAGNLDVSGTIDLSGATVSASYASGGGSGCGIIKYVGTLTETTPTYTADGGGSHATLGADGGDGRILLMKYSNVI